MIKSNLIEIMAKLNSKEIRDFGDFMHSPYFNKNEGAAKLFDYLKKYHPDFPAGKIEKEFIHKNIFHKAVYNDSFMRSLIFKLTSLAEEFITINDFKKDNSALNIRMIGSLIERGIDKQGAALIRQMSSRLREDKNFNSEHFHNLYLLETLKNILYLRTYKPLTVKDKPDDELISESDNLIKFFLIAVLRRYRYMLNKASTVRSSFKLDFLNEILEYLSQDGKKFLSEKLIWILYKQVMLMLTPEDESIFFELKEVLTNDTFELDKEERKDGLTVLSNYSIDRAYSNPQYKNFLHELHKYLIERNLYNRVQGGYFETSMFNNIVTVGLSAEDEDWVINFIEKFRAKLSPDSRSNSYNMNYAKYYFKKKDFDGALKHISKVDYEDIYYKINVRTLSSVVHYELNNFETLLNTLESFKKYIVNDKLLTDQHKTVSNNFIRFTTQLCKIKANNLPENLDNLKKDITDSYGVPYRKWLLEKADELEVRKR